MSTDEPIAWMYDSCLYLLQGSAESDAEYDERNANPIPKVRALTREKLIQLRDDINCLLYMEGEA